VRYRVDGVLHEAARFESATRGGITNRIKMMAEMDTSETGVPQDGRLPWKLTDRDLEFDIRVSCQPFIFGEGFVMRILDRSRVLIGLDKLGFYEDQLNALMEIASEPNGTLAVSGPTGSGKTTTIYSLLAQLISPEKKVLTIEDPVEYQITGANQVQVHKKAGLTFPVALRAFLRHDPDIIYVGEMRDLETASVAAEAALTGHLVITTLHTSDALQTLVRLVDMGVEPYLVAATVIGATAQRLARRVCQACKTEVPPDPSSPPIKFLGITEDDLRSHTIYRGQGCDTCRKTGYKGRLGIFEVLKIDRELASMINERPPLSELLEAARSKGFMTMREDARRKVLDGLTTPEEALRVLV
jgi:type II secretory ATPase GspE/PulE/Tfp pilus assembly ATPase PilB-like protein